ncbi:unnamed protein product [Absidia cylindrospora]
MSEFDFDILTMVVSICPRHSPSSSISRNNLQKVISICLSEYICLLDILPQNVSASIVFAYHQSVVVCHEHAGDNRSLSLHLLGSDALHRQWEQVNVKVGFVRLAFGVAHPYRECIPPYLECIRTRNPPGRCLYVVIIQRQVVMLLLVKLGQTRQGQTRQGQTRQGQTRQGQTVVILLLFLLALQMLLVFVCGHEYRPGDAELDCLAIS